LGVLLARRGSVIPPALLDGMQVTGGVARVGDLDRVHLLGSQESFIFIPEQEQFARIDVAQDIEIGNRVSF